jgi:hypothetical protein
MDKFLNLYDKNDHPSYGMYKISLDEVADALGYWKGFDSNLRPYYRILHELTNEYLVEYREFIIVPMDDDVIPYKTRFYTKHAYLLLAMICKKHRKRNWLDNKRLMRDHKCIDEEYFSYYSSAYKTYYPGRDNEPYEWISNTAMDERVKDSTLNLNVSHLNLKNKLVNIKKKCSLMILNFYKITVYYL